MVKCDLHTLQLSLGEREQAESQSLTNCQGFLSSFFKVAFMVGYSKVFRVLQRCI